MPSSRGRPQPPAAGLRGARDADWKDTITIQRDVVDEAPLAVRQALGAEKRVPLGRPVRPWGVSVATVERELEPLDRGSL
jgi:hypothetical protein